MHGQHDLNRQSVVDAVQLAFTSVPEHLLPPGLRGQVPKADAQPGFAVTLRDNFIATTDDILREVHAAATVIDAVTTALRRMWHTSLVQVTHPDGDEAARAVERSITGGTALIFAKTVALANGARLECGREARSRLTHDLKTATSARLRVTVAEYLVATGPDLPRPCVAVMTALHRVPPEDHPKLLEYAKLVSSALASVGYRIVGPDLDLTPNSTMDEKIDPQAWCERERNIVLAADLVVSIIGPYDSWGSSKVVAWAESNAADALVLDDGDELPVTRILNATPGRVDQKSLEAPDAMTDVMRQWGAQHLAHALAHQALAAHAADVVAEAVAAAQAGVVALNEPQRRGLLTERRVVSVVRTPRAFLATTLIEFLAMPAEVRDILIPVAQLALAAVAPAQSPTAPRDDSAGDTFGAAANGRSGPDTESKVADADTGPAYDVTTLRPMSFRMLELAAAKNAWNHTVRYELIQGWFDEPQLAGERQRSVPTSIEDWEARKQAGPGGPQ